MSLKILCLHGYTQSGASFRARTGPLRRSLGRHITWVYATAPHAAATTFSSSEPTATGPAEPSLAWWNMHNGDAQRVWQDVQQSLAALRRVAEEQGPFDGILGFSQGAGMAALLLALGREDSTLPRFRFAVLISGFFPKMDAFAEALQGGGRVQVPSLHVLGAADAVVPQARGQELAQRAFEDAQVCVHEGGHYVPANAEWRRVYKEFIEKSTAVEQEKESEI
ncbi:Ovarian cancer-associated protein 2 [Coemansia interrupta]|uniref:Ovarian cancer-associated protein 2 n=1 Tax=Coemansia interrupta TaxID=1126814 RepID=A0A9W8H800_9FUNG|nr:Ovarian cancer-associated protein 2 [Coemansia interrupta]